MKGMIHCYTGDGKGKTTAAIGLGIRAIGAGKKVLMIQFLKDGKSSEIGFLQKYALNFKIKSFGSNEFILNKKGSKKDFELCKNAMQAWEQAMQSHMFDVIILDELNIAIDFELVAEKQVIDLLKKKPGDLEIIITGRNASDTIIKKADLVTRMEEVKHYYEKGISARKGIEF